MGAPTVALDQLFAQPEGKQQKAIRPLDEAYQQFTATRYPGATYPEFLVFWWLEQNGYREYRDFYYQLNLLGGRTGGGFVADFLLTFTHPAEDLEVQGTAFHADAVFSDPADVKAYDIIKREALERAGYKVVWVSDVRLINALEESMRIALQGSDAL